MSITPQLLVGLAPVQVALLLTAFGVGAEPNPQILEHLPEAQRAPLTRRARALLALNREKRVRFATAELRRRLAEDHSEDRAQALARLGARLEAQDQGRRRG